MSLSFDNYDDFQASVAAYLQRANLTAQIPLFIQLAEARLGNTIKTLPQQVGLPYLLVPARGTNQITLPSDFGALIRCTYNNMPMTFISPEQLDLAKCYDNNYQFTIIGNTLYLQTYIDGTSQLAMYYYQSFQGLSESNESNWLLEDYPNIYLYATLLEASPYLIDDERIQVWAGMLTEAVQEAKDAARIANTPQKTKLTRTRS
ncbi:phage adaptor protein [Burkholderia vietnamiensis]|uniref:phage adaptor protein n=1 Tax=Burkholderia vietnamiensis TaxID=60552 RepID=UPI00158B822C|nr:hypothetical protein [Burkholderia vietnamiensis]